MVIEIELFESVDVDFSLWGWSKGEVYEWKADTRDGIAGILDAAAHITKRDDEPRRTVRDLLKVHWGWRSDFRTFIMDCNKGVVSV